MFKSKKSLHLWLPALATVLSALVGGVFLITAKIIPEQSQKPFQATIEKPIASQTIGHEFAVVVKLNNVPEKFHIWAAFEIKDLLWFKQPELNKLDHKCVLNLAENNISQKGSFSLSLIKVSSRGQSVITDWFLKGQNTGRYPGLKISEIPGAARIDIVHGLKFNN